MPRHHRAIAPRSSPAARPILLLAVGAAIAAAAGCGPGGGTPGNHVAAPPTSTSTSIAPIAPPSTVANDASEEASDDGDIATSSPTETETEPSNETISASDDGDVAEPAPESPPPTEETSTTTTTAAAESTTTTTTTTKKPSTRTAAGRRATVVQTVPPRTETRMVITYVTTPSPFGGSNPFVTSAEEASFFACVIHRESSGNPAAVNGSSGAGGLYQFLPSTWNATARVAGRGDLVGLHPSAVDVNNQHYLAHTLYLWQGKHPWTPSDGCR